jgi:hypothetical protein
VDTPPAAFATFIEKRRARYTAQALQVFEEQLENHLRAAKILTSGSDLQRAVDETKAIFRRKLQELATDAIETMTLTGTQTNQLAVEMAADLETGASIS